MYLSEPRSYRRVLSLIQGEPLAIDPRAALEIRDVVERRSRGERLSDDEIGAVIAAKSRNREPVPAGAPKSIAVLSLHGLIMPRVGYFKMSERGTSAEAFGKVFRRAMDDESVGAVVLDIDSPGGSVLGIFDLAELVREYGRSPGGRRKKVFGILNPLGSSGAYLVGAQCDQLYAVQDGDGGSLGVLIIHVDESEALSKEGLKVTVITSPEGGNKAEHSSLRPLTEAAERRLQERSDQYYGMFVRSVSLGRRLSQEVVAQTFGQGRVFGAAELLSRKMVDGVSTLSGVIDQLAGRMTGASVTRPDRQSAEDDDFEALDEAPGATAFAAEEEELARIAAQPILAPADLERADELTSASTEPVGFIRVGSQTPACDAAPPPLATTEPKPPDSPALVAAEPQEKDAMSITAEQLEAMLAKGNEAVVGKMTAELAPVREAVTAAAEAATAAKEAAAEAGSRVEAVSAEVGKLKEQQEGLQASAAKAASDSLAETIRMRVEALSRDGRVLAGEIDSEVKGLLAASPEDRAERFALLGSRAPYLGVATKVALQFDLGDGRTETLSGDPKVYRANPEGTAFLQAVYARAGGREAVKLNPSLLLQAANELDPRGEQFRPRGHEAAH